jgi:hypothetical protein
MGLLNEAALLLSQGVSSTEGAAAPGSMAGKAVGYRQTMDWLLQVRLSSQPRWTQCIVCYFAGMGHTDF